MPQAMTGERISEPVRFVARLRQALPGVRFALSGSVIWGLAMGLSALGSILLRDWASRSQIELVLAVFAVGGALAFAPACVLFNLLSAGRGWPQRFSAALLSLIAATFSVTALVYYMQFRSYFARWHDEVFTHDWFLQTFFTGASAGYQFAVLGLRLYLPFGLPFLFIGAYVLSKNRH